MATPIVMPQMGESIAEGTIVRWIKRVGDSVDRDEPLFEISTDKVDAEIPSPVAGTLVEIKVKEGETVPVNSVVATIGAPGASGASGAPGASRAAGEAGATRAAATAPPSSGKTAASTPQADGTPAKSAMNGAVASAPPAPSAPVAPSAPGGPAAPGSSAPGSSAPGSRQRSSPLVRRIAKEHGVDVADIAGSGIGGRVTKHDILGYIEKAPSVPTVPAATRAPGAPSAPDRVEVQPMSIMRKKIAEHMILSHRTSAHVYSVFEVNYSQVDKIRKANKDEYERQGVKLSFTSFIAKVVVDCLRRHPVINASIDGENIVYKKDVNLGIAVALENGLIVPVVKLAGEKNLFGLSRAIADVADRARSKKLNPDEVHGGTFTITNPGNFGAQFGLPIINQPQVAILGVGSIEKRPVVIDDMIGVRLMGYLTLGYDHRLIDGAVADQFMADVKNGIEAFDEKQL
jgi:pyruvate dehydrogenase E2 component (dihydrolipoamide acetyltransferase)